jgi:hypothetical protein
MALNLNTVKKGVGAAAAIGGLFKKDKPLSGPLGEQGSFTSTIKQYGIARPNKFQVTLHLPRFAIPSNKQVRTLSLYAVDVEIPTREIYTEKSRIYGTSVEMPIDYQYGLTFQVVFYVDNAYQNVSAINDWMDKVVDFESNDINYRTEYEGSVEVEIIDFKLDNESKLFKKPSMVDSIKNSFLKSFDPNNDKYADPVAEFSEDTVVSYMFASAFPKSMQIKRLSNNSKEYQEVTVVFAYTKVSPKYNYKHSEKYLPKIPSNKQSFADKLLGNVTSKVSGFASTAGGVAGSIANIARIGG